VAGPAARGGIRHDEPLAVLRDRPARPGPGGHLGVSRPTRGGHGQLAPPFGPGVRAGGRRRRGRVDPPAAGHRLRRHCSRPASGRMLGQLHPAQPADRAPHTRHPGVGSGGQSVRAGLRADRHDDPDPAPAHARRARVRGRRGHSGFGRAAHRRPNRAAPGAGPLLRALHEREPGPGGRHRPGDPEPVAVVDRLAQHRRHRHRQHGQRRHVRDPRGR